MLPFLLAHSAAIPRSCRRKPGWSARFVGMYTTRQLAMKFGKFRPVQLLLNCRVIGVALSVIARNRIFWCWMIEHAFSRYLFTTMTRRKTSFPRAAWECSQGALRRELWLAHRKCKLDKSGRGASRMHSHAERGNEKKCWRYWACYG